MNARKRLAIGGAALALALLTALGASAHDGRGGDDGGHDGDHVANLQRDDNQNNGAIFSAHLAPSLPTDPAIHGVAAGGLPWVIKRGTVKLDADGRTRVEIRGLVIPIAHGTFPAGTALPVTTVSASLYCAPDASAAAATTGSVPITPDGNARIETTLTLPATCLAPIVLVHPNGGAGAYISATGWRQ